MIPHPGTTRALKLKEGASPRQSGFSLIEIAVVLGIMGFVAFMFVPLLASQAQYGKYRETRSRLEPIRNAVIAFIASNKRLPCPAVETLPSTNANYGREAATPGTCTGTTALTGGAVRGVLPWITLGLTAETVTDGFGRFYTYAVTTTQTNLNVNTVPGMTGIITIHNATPVGPANQTNAGNLAVFIVVSHGSNGYGGFVPGNGAQTPFQGGADELENTNTTDVAFVDKGFTDSAANPFDDVVMWVPAHEILALLAPSGFKTAQGAIVEKLQTIKSALLSFIAADNSDPGGSRSVARRVPCADVDNNGTQNCSNLVGTVPYTTLGITAATATDSWGRAIRYTVGQTSFLSNQNYNTAGIYWNFSPQSVTMVTFSSDGPDGVQGNADDVSLTLTMAELAGILTNAGVNIDSGP